MFGVFEMIEIRHIPKDGSLLINKDFVITTPASFGISDNRASISIKGSMSRLGENNFALKGIVDACFTMSCSLCLEHVDEIESRFEIEALFVKGDDSAEAFGFSGDKIDYTPAILSGISSIIPMRFLCDDECKGLCAKCGQNQNLAKCDCDFGVVNEEFLVIKDFMEAFELNASKSNASKSGGESNGHLPKG
jgi:uncharacterized metal-binding protein YceD (DUF177 family)